VSGFPATSWTPAVTDTRYVSPGTSLAFGVHLAVVGLGRSILPATLTFALSA
jgi:hypothetical protein